MIVEPTARPRRRLVTLGRGPPWRTVGLVLLTGFLLLNLLAYRHAGAMLHYSSEADRTPTPRALSNWQKAKVLVCGVTVPRPENTRSPEDLGPTAETVHFVADD